MANTTALKMVYVIDMNGDKEITKSKTISDINTNATNEQVLGLANAILTLQTKPAHISRIDSQNLAA